MWSRPEGPCTGQQTIYLKYCTLEQAQPSPNYRLPIIDRGTMSVCSYWVYMGGFQRVCLKWFSEFSTLVGSTTIFLACLVVFLSQLEKWNAVRLYLFSEKTTYCTTYLLCFEECTTTCSHRLVMTLTAGFMSICQFVSTNSWPWFELLLVNLSFNAKQA